MKALLSRLNMSTLVPVELSCPPRSPDQHPLEGGKPPLDHAGFLATRTVSGQVMGRALSGDPQVANSSACIGSRG